ncbi:hypothetical protein GALMADRAFT_219030 [Galerina marginata CBS 339.88]|uniref:Uncharacterized protein n=1 Tax=Galerina marginata (strain CBS 339.88) TaxID=685588 RepID=A0A067TS05_GALM3|nr:hypothetical protein GALMADRAFT_219030 [Galerina marginata CBS 339.88]
MAPRSILKSLPFISHFPLPDPYSTSRSDGNSVLSPSLFNNPLPYASSSHIPPLESPHVHFPPTPILTRMGMTHSPFSYDRGSITVSPNVCALPERGERNMHENEKDEHETPEHLQRDYFHPTSFSQNTQRQGESCSPRFLTSRSGSRSISPARRPRTTRMRCHSLPNSPPQSLSPRIYPRHRRHTDPYTSTSRHQSPLAVPLLVFDHSSESDSSDDACVSPQPQVTDTDYITSTPLSDTSHFSAHIPGGLSLKPGGVPFSEAGLDGGQLSTIMLTKMNGGTDSSDGLSFLSRTRTQGSSPCGFSTFCEPVLEGCLGGF